LVLRQQRTERIELAASSQGIDQATSSLLPCIELVSQISLWLDISMMAFNYSMLMSLQRFDVRRLPISRLRSKEILADPLSKESFCY
tara:strand:+ start:36 stop:296 length:261 start_codon:yes stop_codon:yes gene_type:complete